MTRSHDGIDSRAGRELILVDLSEAVTDDNAGT
jgi:hypothetical protein